ncbi:hypothetical protein COOONC_19279 [Cooperia oncophora]
MYPHRASLCSAILSSSIQKTRPTLALGGYSDVMRMGNADDRLKLAKIEREIQPDDPINIQYTSKTIICIPNPLYHCFGCVLRVNLRSQLIWQTMCLPAHRSRALARFKLLTKNGSIVQSLKCTALYGTPTMFIDMLNHPDYHQYNYDSIRSGFIAGAPCPITLCRRLVNEMHMRDMQVSDSPEFFFAAPPMLDSLVSCLFIMRCIGKSSQ